jgi:hypothetical protein
MRLVSMARTTEAFIIGACASETVSRERLFGQSYGWRNGRAQSAAGIGALDRRSKGAFLFLFAEDETPRAEEAQRECDRTLEAP